MDDHDEGSGAGPTIVLLASLCLTIGMAAWFILG